MTGPVRDESLNETRACAVPIGTVPIVVAVLRISVVQLARHLLTPRRLFFFRARLPNPERRPTRPAFIRSRRSNSRFDPAPGLRNHLGNSLGFAGSGGLSVSFVPGFASSLSSTGLERWSLRISLAPTPGSTGVALIPVAKAPAVHLK